MVMRGRIDLLGPARRRIDQLLGDTPNLAQPPARVELDLVTDPPEVMGEVVAIDLAGDHLLGEHGAGFEAHHLLVTGMAGHVEDDDMGMGVRIELARGVFGKTRLEKLARRLVGNLAVPSATGFLMPPDPGDGRPNPALPRRD